MRFVRMTHRVGLAVALSGAVASAAGAQARWPTLDDFLTNAVQLTPAQRAVLSRGDVVVRLLPTADHQNVAVFGAVQVDVPRSFFADRQRDVPAALEGPRRSEVRLFSDPPTTADVQDIQIPRGELKNLRGCHSGECNTKLPLHAMEELRAIADSSAPDAGERVSEAYRQWLVSYVTDYRRRGNEAMVVYDDEAGVRSNDALGVLLRDSSYVSGLPSLERWLLDDSRTTPPGAQEIFFWSRDDLPHLRRVLRVQHELIYSPPEIPSLTIVAAKQIYADHYFEAGLEVLAAADRDGGGTAAAQHGITLVAIRRYRFDHLPSGGLFNVRGRVVNGLRDNLVADLRRIARDTEAAWRSRSGGR